MNAFQVSLWFDTQAEEAANFYTQIFPNSSIVEVVRNGEGNPPHPAGSVLLVNFKLNGMEFVALNGGPEFHFTEAVSIIIPVETQEEVDHYWNALSAVPEAEACGWLKDKYGLSWQVVPTQLDRMMADASDPARWKRVTECLLQMKKIDIAELQAAYDGV